MRHKWYLLNLQIEKASKISEKEKNPYPCNYPLEKPKASC
jgi:hypothetical protein